MALCQFLQPRLLFRYQQRVVDSLVFRGEHRLSAANVGNLRNSRDKGLNQIAVSLLLFGAQVGRIPA
ncbi:hypothetical protein D3C87_2194960 [compost metagenome]